MKATISRESGPRSLDGRGVRFHNGDAFGALVVRPHPDWRERWVVGVLDQTVEFSRIISSWPGRLARRRAGVGVASPDWFSMLGGSTRGIAVSSRSDTRM